MSNFIDYYKILQVHHEAEQDIITAAYRCISRIYHPDVNNNSSSSEKMQMINVAYNTIGNPEKREAYHHEWLLKNQGTFTVRRRPDTKDLKRKFEEEAGKKALEKFFDLLIELKWEESYHMLTSEDKKNVPLEDYIKWKEAVEALYRLGGYKISHYKTHANCDYAGKTFNKVLHYSIDLTEMEVSTGKVNKEHTRKFVIKEDDGYKVCLGHQELRSSIRKLRYLAQVMPKINKDELVSRALSRVDAQTGLYSKTGFLDEVLKETKRSERYGNPLSLALIDLRADKKDSDCFDEEKDILAARLAEILSNKTRETDIIGRWGNSTFAILYVETKLENAGSTTVRLAQSAYKSCNGAFALYWAVSSVEGGNVESLLSDAFNRLAFIEPHKEDDETVKLGKYHLSDILEFNKKGRNHF